MVLLMIMWGIVMSVREKLPTSDVYSVGTELISSAYSAAGTTHYFSGDALLVNQEFDATALRDGAGLPKKAKVGIVCREPYCLYEDEPVSERGDCASFTTACPYIALEQGDKIKVCAICSSETKCFLVLGEMEC